MPLSAGDVFAGYTVVRPLGSGGMGSVYLVRHPRLPRLEALKLLRPELSGDPTFAARFRREAAAAAALHHRNVVPVRDQGEEGGQLWLVMDYVEGWDVEEELRRTGGILPADRAAHILSQVAAGLDAAHRQRLVHRDVKPANVLLAPGVDGEPEQIFLTDFGIAKSLDAQTAQTTTGAVLATFEYASPEQIESRPVDGRADVYALGCLLVRMLTGEVPYPGGSMAGAIHGHLVGIPPRPSRRIPWLPPAIDDVVGRALAKDPADRYPTCRSLAAAAAEALADFPDVPELPWTVTLSRTDEAGTTSVVPVLTAGLSSSETEHLVGLARRTRVFDLPSDLSEAATSIRGGPARRPVAQRLVTLELASAQRSRRIVADLDGPGPAAFAELVATVDRLGAVPADRTTAQPSEPATTRPPAPVPDEPEPLPARRARRGAARGGGRRRGGARLAAVASAVLLVAALVATTLLVFLPDRRHEAAATTDNGEGAKTGLQVAADAAAAMERAGAMRAQGTLTENGRTQTLDVLYQGTWNALGTITIAGQTGELMATAGEDYLKAPAGFWPTQGLQPPAVPALADTWVHMPRAAADVAFPMSLGGLVSELRHPETAAIEDPVVRSTRDGQPVVVITLTDGSTYDVAATGPPYVVHMRSFGTRPGEVSFGEIGRKRTVLKPAAIEYAAPNG